MSKFSIITYILIVFLITGCGFKVLDQSQLKNYKILEIRESGDKKSNFFIKNKLYNLLNSNNSTNELIIDIKTYKEKAIKEKNKKNQITKYNIKINSTIELNFINMNLRKTINLNEENFYNVNVNHNVTQYNEKNSEKNIIDELSQEMSAANSLDILLRPTPSADDMIEEIEEIEEEPEPETIDIKTQPMEHEISYIPVRILLKRTLSSTF